METRITLKISQSHFMMSGQVASVTPCISASSRPACRDCSSLPALHLLQNPSPDTACAQPRSLDPHADQHKAHAGPVLLCQGTPAHILTTSLNTLLGNSTRIWGLEKLRCEHAGTSSSRSIWQRDNAWISLLAMPFRLWFLSTATFDKCTRSLLVVEIRYPTTCNPGCFEMMPGQGPGQGPHSGLGDVSRNKEGLQGSPCPPQAQRGGWCCAA